MTRWTKEEINFITTYYPTHPLEEIAQELNRTPGSVKTKAIRMGVHKNKRETTVDNEGNLFCSVCKRHLNAKIHFHKNKKTESGYSVYCKFCSSPEQRQARKIERLKEVTAKEFYTCTRCHEEKAGGFFRWSTRKMKRERMCQQCITKREKGRKAKRIKEGLDW